MIGRLNRPNGELGRIFRGIFEDAVQQAKANLEDVTFDNVLGID